MKVSRAVILGIVFCLAGLYGCGKKVDESKALSEVEAEAKKMDAAKLRSIAMKYQDAIMVKKDEVAKVAAKLKEIPVTEMLGSEAKKLKSEIDVLNKSVSALKERFEVYYKNLKAKGGELSGLGV